MVELPYENKEIIAVNDGSMDRTGSILHRLAKIYPCVRIIDCKENRGKATALNLACHASRAEYLVCVDSDAILDSYAIHYLIFNFSTAVSVSAVTGNPRIRNRDTLGKIAIGRVRVDYRRNQTCSAPIQESYDGLRRCGCFSQKGFGTSNYGTPI